mgnify:CR=1 FL=1
MILEINEHMSTLMDFRYKRKYVAANGMDGQGKRCSGKDGEDLIIKVPRGTVVRDAETKEIICDMSQTDRFVLARGGNGGWGNKHFATPTRQVPRFAKAGLPGQSRDVILELKLLADVGLVGFPNVGKSTLLSVVSKARPKIANYHFTTLFPNLGVVYVEEGVSFVLADIPGIIEGAAEGAGLGHDFLRHIDRCRLLIHVVDVSGSEGRDPVADFEAIQAELKEYGSGLENRPMLVAGNKVDIAADRSGLEALKAHVEAKGLPFFEISAAAQVEVYQDDSAQAEPAAEDGSGDSGEGDGSQTEGEEAQTLADQPWLISASGKLLEAAPEGSGALSVTGLTVLAPQAGTMLAVPQEQQSRLATLKELLSALEAAGELDQVSSIDLTHSTWVGMRYRENFDARLPLGEDMAHSLAVLSAAGEGTLQTRGPQAAGTMDLTQEMADAIFTPAEQ